MDVIVGQIFFVAVPVFGDSNGGEKLITAINVLKLLSNPPESRAQHRQSFEE